jgi:hypothetical protein
VIVVEMAKGICIHARILVEADQGWTDQQISAALSLIEEKCSMCAKTERYSLLPGGHYRHPVTRNDRIIVQNDCLILQIFQMVIEKQVGFGYGKPPAGRT